MDSIVTHVVGDADVDTDTDVDVDAAEDECIT